MWLYWKNPETKKKLVTLKGTAKSRICEAETPKPIAIKFCMPDAVRDVITRFNFGEDQYRFWCAKGSNLGLCHWRASSPLKHARTTMRVCDEHMLSMLQRATRSVQQTCQRLEPCWRMTSSSWRVVSLTAAGGRQWWVGWTWVQEITFQMTPSPWQPIRR